MLREGQPWERTLGASEEGPGVCEWALAAVGQAGQGTPAAATCHGQILPKAIALEGPFLPHPCQCQLLQGTPGAVPT